MLYTYVSPKSPDACRSTIPSFAPSILWTICTNSSRSSLPLPSSSDSAISYSASRTVKSTPNRRKAATSCASPTSPEPSVSNKLKTTTI